MITAKQSKAARALLGWNQSYLAKAAGLARPTIADFERGARDPVTSTMTAIEQTLKNAGIRFSKTGVDLLERP